MRIQCFEVLDMSAGEEEEEVNKGVEKVVDKGVEEVVNKGFCESGEGGRLPRERG